MTIYKTPRLKLTPAEERAADVMEWVHAQLLWAALAVRADRNPATMASLAAIALLERMALPSAILDPADPLRLFMHEDVATAEGEARAFEAELQRQQLKKVRAESAEVLP